MVKINGIQTEAQGKTLAQYLADSSFDAKRVAVELNGKILPKAQYDSTFLCDGDSVEIVSFVGGG